MDVLICPRRLSGTVTPPPSKSMAHRLLLAAALAEGESVIRNVVLSRDVEAMLRCTEALGARWHREGDGVRVWGSGGVHTFREPPRFDCGESATALRFLLPVALAAAGGGVFTGRGRLMERPLGPYLDLFREKGVDCRLERGVLTVRGVLPPGGYRLPGNVSSQFFSGLLFALPLLSAPSRLASTTALESAGYVTMTQRVLARAGVSVTGGGCLWEVEPSAYRPLRETVEADWSQAAFWYAARFLGGTPELRGLKGDTCQGDAAVAALYDRLSVPGEAEVDVSGCPDLLPPLAVMAAARKQDTRFVRAGRLRWKESDRLHTVCALLLGLGGQAEEGEDSLLVRGGAPLTGGEVSGENDHRIVMAAAIAASVCTESVTIRGAEAVEKSYPGFWEDYKRLGGEVHVL